MTSPVSVKHTFVSVNGEDQDASLVAQNAWNAEHAVVVGAPGLLGRSASGSGPAEVVTVGSGLSLAAGVLSVPSGPGGNPHLIIGSTIIDGGVSGQFLYDNAGVLGVATPAGGGGGGGSSSDIVVAATIAALQALTIPADGTIAFVSDPLRGGEFVFSNANHSVDVLHDPGSGVVPLLGGITIPPASKPDGTQGAWLRRYKGGVRWSWWGVVSDGVVVDPYGQESVHSNVIGVSNPSGTTIRLALVSTAGMTTGDNVTVSGVGGVTNANGKWTITVVGSSVDLTGVWPGAGGSAPVFDGAWTSGGLVNDVSTYGPHIISGTDNTQALNNWQIWAYYQSQAKKDVTVYADAGTILWTSKYAGTSIRNIPQFDIRGAVTGFANVDGSGDGSSTNYQCLSGVKNLIVECDNGFCAIQNTMNLANGVWNSTAVLTPFPTRIAGVYRSYPSTGGFLINQTEPGQTSLTVVTQADLANFTIGDWFLLGSFDVQGYGDPANLQYYEYHKIAAISGSTVFLNEPIVYQHRTDYPDVDAFIPCGRARIWALTRGWEGSYILRNIGGNVLPGTYNNSQAVVLGISLGGLYVETNNWKGLGFSETEAQQIIHYNPVLKAQGEIDKLVECITYINGKSETWGLVVQSCCPRLLTIIGGHYAGLGGLGQKTIAQGVHFDSVTLDCHYGYSAGAVFDGCEINSVNGEQVNDAGILDGMSTLSIDGTSITYLNGVITIPGSLGGFAIGPWELVPGQTICLLGHDANAYTVTNYAGSGIVRSTTQPGSNVLIETDLRYATLPPWFTQLGVFHVGQVEFNNCWGGDQVRVFSRACAKGLAYYEYKEYVFADPQGASLLKGDTGELISIEVDVTKAGAIAGAQAAFTFTLANCTAGLTDVGAIVFTVDLTVVGKRFITQSAIALLGTDSATLAGSGITKIPPGLIGLGYFNHSAGVFYTAHYLAPTYVLKITTDGGIVRKGASIREGISGTGALVVVKGPLP